MTDPHDPDDFARALAFTLAWEAGEDGGYTENPHDPGGRTRWGISERTYPALDVRALTREQAAALYRQDYWADHGSLQQSGAAAMPWPLSLVHFDCVVNVGNYHVARDGTPVYHRRANMILQRALDVRDDGYLGPVSRAAWASGDALRWALRAITQRQLYYALLGPWARPFQKGWFERCNALRDVAMRPVAAAA
jgi:lysozyme family protein